MTVKSHSHPAETANGRLVFFYLFQKTKGGGGGGGGGGGALSVGNLKNVTSRTELQNYSYVNKCRQHLLCWGISKMVL